MNARREQRLVFGEDAELYDRARPGYTDGLVDDVLAFASYRDDPGACRALELGAGTGKATVALAGRGVRVVALEPDAAMAAVAARHCRALDVRVEPAQFEDWPAEEGAFDLLYSAQARHWMRPEVRVELAARHLRPGGTIALFWHRVQWADDDPLRADLDACYRAHAPALYERGPGFTGLTPGAPHPSASDELRGAPEFGDVAERAHPWTASCSVEGFVDLLRTQSDHRLLDPGERDRLLDAVRDVLSGHEAPLAVPYRTLLVLAHRR